MEDRKANARAQAAAEQETAVVRRRFLAAGTLDNASAHVENRCERLEEGFVRERDRAAAADVVLADLGVQLREEQVMVSEFQDKALGIQAQLDEFVEQYEESVATELRRELQHALMQFSRGSWLAEQQQRQLESAPVEPAPERLGTLRTKAASDSFRVTSLALGPKNDCWTQCGFLLMSMKSLLWLWLLREIVIENTVEERKTVFCATVIKVSTVPYLNESCMSLSGLSSGPHGQTFAPAHEFSSVNMSNEVRYKSCSLHKKVFTAPTNVIILYVLIRILEFQPIQFRVM